MRVIDSVEVLYLSLMQRWERTAPADRHEGERDGITARNTQAERLAFVIGNIAVGRHADSVYSTLARYTRRDDGNSYISKDPSWMVQPVSLTDGWYFEGCTSLIQKQSVLNHLGKLGLSGVFSQAAEDFVANKSIQKYFPKVEDEPEILERIRAWDEEHNCCV